MGLLGNRGRRAKPATVPKLFVCPIMLDIMTDPTTTACGHMFERDAILNWINAAAKEAKCPSCNQPISEDKLAPCFPVKSAIEDWRAEHQVPGDDDDGATTLTETMKQQLQRHTNRLLSSRSSQSISSKLEHPSGQRPRSGSNADAMAGRPRSGSGSSGGGSSIHPVIWARLEPLNRQYERIDINKDSFVIGRSAGADFAIARQQLSGRHCNIYRLARDPNAAEIVWDVFLEDLSANGTYLNGRRQLKNTPTALRQGDEISLCNRFVSQEKPTIPLFLDWAFVGEVRNPTLSAEIEKAKTAAPDFDHLLAVTDSRLLAVGVASADTRQKILTALAAWEEEHNMPVYKYVEVNGEDPTAVPTSAAANVVNSRTGSQGASSPSSLIPSSAASLLANRAAQKTGSMPKAAVRVSTSMPLSPRSVLAASSSPRSSATLPAASSSAGAGAASAGSPASASPSSGRSAPSIAPCVFAPSTYVTPWDDHTVTLSLRRATTSASAVTVFVSTTDESTALVGVDFSDMLGTPVSFEPARTTASLTFKWGAGKNWTAEPASTASVIKIVFAISLVPNGPVADTPDDVAGDTTAVLLLEPPGSTPSVRPGPAMAAGPAAPGPSIIAAQLVSEGAIAPPSTDATAQALAAKVATVFRHVPQATITAAIELERQISKSADADAVTAEAIQDSVVRKLLWYQSLPDGDPTTVSGAAGSAGAAAAAAAAAPVAAETGGASTTPRTTSATLQRADSPQGTRARTGSNDGASSGGSAATSSKSAMSVMPRIGGMPAFTSNGWLPPSELEPYVLAVTLQYLRSKPENLVLLAQNYRLCATHHTSLESGICREVASVVTQSARLASTDGYAERDVRSLLRAAADHALANLQSSYHPPAKDASRLTSAFETHTVVRPVAFAKRPAFTMSIGDMNGLYDIPEPAPMHSFHAVLEGYGSAFAARYVSLHLPSILASQGALAANRVSDAIEKACRLVHDDVLIANLRQNTINSGCQLALVFIRDQTAYVSTVGGLTVHLLKTNKSGAVASMELVSPTVPAGKFECIGAHPNAATAASGKGPAADMVTTGHTCTARTLQLKLPDLARYLLITSRSFWSANVTEANVIAAINGVQNSALDLPTVTQRLSAMSTGLANDLAVAVLQIMHK